MKFQSFGDPSISHKKLQFIYRTEDTQVDADKKVEVLYQVLVGAETNYYDYKDDIPQEEKKVFMPTNDYFQFYDQAYDDTPTAFL